ncbi:Histidyl-tRNA synthetase [Candidatus Johnevansia muelleri]|uniref:Histidine--tRNA ligase n=1 Tax=Candidatus Johnevansia muelleri TaxID=1495769 RepID=A0A078KI20_9GAMM|nr:Histidyl-tRNA synthetase [Candidatus Evansia muelleri]
MSNNIQSIRGMNDLLPEQSLIWQYVEMQLRLLVSSYGYLEIRTPIIEKTALFNRSIGKYTDIVEKEMYTFKDRNDVSISLRPENTAAVLRAAIVHGLLHKTQRLWYMGPMFRYERPQKGRYRQFHQFGIETFNMEGPDIDAELIIISYRLWKILGLSDYVTLELNSLGSKESLKAYSYDLVSYLKSNKNHLDDESIRRININPLRLLDSKNPDIVKILKGIPSLLDYIDKKSAAHFDLLKTLLNDYGIKYRINPYLVRGLDYYSRTVFEWTTMGIGSKIAICAGGRYDNLVEEMSGKTAPAAGFAIGIERLILLLKSFNLIPIYTSKNIDIYITTLGDRAKRNSINLADKLRDSLPYIRLQIHWGKENLKKQLKKADISKAYLAIIIGKEECETATVIIKYLREEREQQTISQSSLVDHLQRIFLKV